MYEAFYKLTEKPFSLTPDPSFLFLGLKHSAGLAMLRYGLANQASITVLTGEIGSGKTTLIRKLLDELDDDISVGLIANTHESFGNLMQWISVAFGLPVGTKSKAALYDKFSTYLIDQYGKGKRTVLIVDEAQNLDATTLEELRLLSNINVDKAQILQLVLVGQPELRDTLRRRDLKQFVQRIGVDYHLPALEPEETDEYIAHRIKTAGGDPDLFEPIARRFIHYQCGGVPRLINSMCDTALVYGYAEQAPRINAEQVYEMVQERIRSGLFGAGLTAQPFDATIGTLSRQVDDAMGQAVSDLDDVNSKTDQPAVLK